MSDSEEPPDSEHLEVSSDAERNRLWRTVRFVLAVMIFYVVMLFLDYEHETILLIVGAVCFLLWMLYMLVMIIVTICAKWSPVDLADTEDQILTSNEMTTSAGGLSSTSLADDLYSVPFAKTPQFIRSNLDPVTPGVSPVDGWYDIVYNAIFFGKTLRSQARLQLSFQSTSSGWAISGSSETASGSRALSEGFVNSIGQVYWIIDDDKEQPCIYRGVMDIEASSMWDGEFQSVNGESRARGRIVRLEKRNDRNAIGMVGSGSDNNVKRSNTSSYPSSIKSASKRTVEMVDLERQPQHHRLV